MTDKSKTLGVEAPTLADLSSRPCSLEEIQAALVKLIGIVNDQNEDVAREINQINRNKQDREWRASL